MVSARVYIAKGNHFIPIISTAFLSNSFALLRIVIHLPRRPTWATEKLDSAKDLRRSMDQSYTPKEPVRLQGVTIMKLVGGLFLKPLGIARIQQANLKAWRLTKTKKVLLKPSLNLHMVTVDKN